MPALAELRSVLFRLVAGPPVWCEGLLAQGVTLQAELTLGKISDYALAKQLGCQRSTVKKARRARGIPACPLAPIGGRPRLDIDWDAQPLGEKTDMEIADALGVSNTTVRLARVKRSIPACRVHQLGVDWDKEPLGEESDKLIALMLDVSVSAVARARNERGIPPHRSHRGITWQNE